MEITKKDLEQLEQNINKESKKDHFELVKSLREESKKDLLELEQNIDKKSKKDHIALEKSLLRQNQVMYEKFQQDIRIIGEGWQMNAEKTNATFELAGETKEDIEIIKMDISFIKNALKQKADKDEVEALEKRVIILENKFKRA